MTIAVNTFFTTSYQPLADITTKGLMDYCARHGYHLFVNKIPDGNVDYIKTVDARKLLDEFDLVWSVECDLLITNHNIKIESFIDDEHDFFICQDINGVNGGSCITKATDLGKGWLDLTNSQVGKSKTEQTFWEVSALLNNNVKILSHPSINSFPMDYYATSFGKIGYKEGDIIERPTHEQGAWQVGDFICHLPGMTLPERLRIFNELKQYIIYE